MGVGYVEPILFFYTVMLYINVPIEKQLIRNKVCLSAYNETTFQTIFMHPTVEAFVTTETAKWDMINNIVRTVPTIISTVLIGIWSDGVGRKKVMLIPLFGETVQAVGYFLNSWFIAKPVEYLFIGSAVTGLCGNLPTMLMIMFAYTADVTTTQQRTTRIIILDAVVFFASIISLFIGGHMLMKISLAFGLRFGFVAVYSVDLVLLVFIFIYYLFLNESYFPTEPLFLRDVCSTRHFHDYARLLAQKPSSYYRPKFLLLSGCFCMLFFVTTGVSEMIILYVFHTPLSFTPVDLSLVLVTEAGVKFMGALLLTLVGVRVLGLRDGTLILVCSLAVAGYASCLGVSRKHWQVYVSTLWGIGECEMAVLEQNVPNAL